MSYVLYVVASPSAVSVFGFFFNDTATTEIYTRSLVGSVRMCIRDSCIVSTGIVTEDDFVNEREGDFGIGFFERQRCIVGCLLYTSPSPRDRTRYRMPSSA